VPVSKAKLLELAARRQRVAAGYLAGQSQDAIAAAEGVHKSQVTRDLVAIRKDWRAAACRDYDTKLAEELARLARIEAEAWAGWEQSKQDAETRYAGSDKTWKRTEGQAGDPRFLERLCWCVEQRLKLLGAYAKEPFKSASEPGRIMFIEVVGVSPGAKADRPAAVPALLQ
jgi:hypothetical protein